MKKTPASNTTFPYQNDHGMSEARLAWLMVVFSYVASYESYSKAAEKLGLAKSTVSKEISDLENGLGAKLLLRSSRSVRLTDAGRAFYEACKELQSTARAAGDIVSNLQAAPTGTLKIAAPVTFGSLFVMPAIIKMMTLYPQLRIDVELTDRPIDLRDGQVDVLIQATNSPPPDSIAKKIAHIDWMLCAAPRYLSGFDPIIAPDDLAAHRFLLFRGDGNTARIAMNAGTRTAEISVAATIRSNNSRSLAHAAESGLGIALVPSYAVADSITDGRLVPLLPKWRIRETSIFACYLPTRTTAPKIRVFVEQLIETAKVIPLDSFDASGHLP
jgi:DNA-binding transcriptional LysR family regulator